MGYKLKQSKTIETKTDLFYYAFRNILLVSIPLIILSTLILTLPHSSATISDSSSDSVTLSLSTSCTLSSSVEEIHHARLNGGQYESEVGSTKINAYCNDNNGYAIYAIGSSRDTDGNNDLINSTNEDYNIHTGTYDTNNPSSLTSSSWSMKLISGTGTGINPDTGESMPVTPPAIMNSYNDYNVVPNNYTLVAKRTSGTNMTTNTEASGSYFNTTYAIYASSVQPAGDYAGKVKYLMVHPGNNTPNVINDIDAAFAAAGKQKVYQDENSSYYAMQDMSTDICNLVLRTGEATSAQLVDIRDNKLYWVTKEKDHHCWMTQNLDLDINGSDTQPLNSTNTDISANTETYASSGAYASGYIEDDGVWTWIPDDTTSNSIVDYNENKANNWRQSTSAPTSAEGGDIYIYTSDSNNSDIIYNSLSDCKINHSEADCEHYHIGNYYNWTSAIASNNSGMLSMQYDSATNSICPKGWRLPIAINNNSNIREFGDLLVAENIILSSTTTSYSTNGFNIIRKAPLWFVRSGYINRDGGLQKITSNAFYWSSVVGDSFYAYYFTFNSSSINSAYYGGDYGRYYGQSVRCVAR